MSSVASVVQFGFGVSGSTNLAMLLGFSNSANTNQWFFNGPTNIPRRISAPTLTKIRVIPPRLGV